MYVYQKEEIRNGHGGSHTLHLLVSAQFRFYIDRNDNLLVSESHEIIIRRKRNILKQNK